MTISRDELVNVLTVVNFLAHAEREMHAAEKKILIAVFKAAAITPEEQKQMKENTSLEEMLKHIQSVEAKHALVELMALEGADDHPYFDDNNLDVPSVRANVGKILNSFKTLAS